MLEKEDLAAIRGIFREELHSDATKDFFVGIMGEMLEDVVLPRFAEMDERHDRMEASLAAIKGEMVTTDHFEKRIFALKGELANSGIRASHQVKTLATELHRNGVITVDQFVLATAP